MVSDDVKEVGIEYKFSA